MPRAACACAHACACALCVSTPARAPHCLWRLCDRSTERVQRLLITLFKALPSLQNVGLLAFILFYTFAILGVRCVGPTALSPRRRTRTAQAHVTGRTATVHQPGTVVEFSARACAAAHADTSARTFPSFKHACLLCVFSLFKGAKKGGGGGVIDDHTNFDNFGNALLTLTRGSISLKTQESSTPHGIAFAFAFASCRGVGHPNLTCAANYRDSCEARVHLIGAIESKLVSRECSCSALLLSKDDLLLSQ